MAAKLKDGLFLGDYEAAHDLEFIVANKITHIINCAGRETPNGWERSGIRYLTYFWPDNGNCIIFDESNAVLDEIYTFIESTIDMAESVLVHSVDGVSRACFCCAVYFMLKYRWYAPVFLSVSPRFCILCPALFRTGAHALAVFCWWSAGRWKRHWHTSKASDQI